jgi:hypothetical protein
MEGRERFQLRFTGIGRLVARPAGTGQWSCWIVVSPTTVEVRMGWVFHAAIPRSSILSASEYHKRVPVTIGVHGSRRRWTLNGASTGLVEIVLDPPVRARACWVLSASLKDLIVSARNLCGQTTLAGLVTPRAPRGRVRNHPGRPGDQTPHLPRASDPAAPHGRMKEQGRSKEPYTKEPYIRVCALKSTSRRS